MIPPGPVAEPAPAVRAWEVRGRVVPLDRPRILGILNVTPDSFSDGGRWLAPEQAIDRALQMLDEGADIIDVGGESTRPQGAQPVDAAEELRRVIPVVAGIARRAPDAIISVDTVKSRVAATALGEGAHIINDVSAFRLDGEMPAACAAAGAGVILMHSRGGVSTMGTYRDAAYGDDVVGEVCAELEQQIEVARRAGIPDGAIAVDPGIGFAKRGEHSVAVLAGLGRVIDLGHPVVVGVSRKRFIGEFGGGDAAGDRLPGTIAANVVALVQGARLFRVHDVRENRQALDVAWRLATES